MAVIGDLIKKALDITGKIISEPHANAAQKDVLRNMLENARFTAFGKKYQFSKILADEDVIRSFQEKVPIHDYDKIYNEWWHYLLEGHQNVTWPGGQQYFALSSGTTSASKSIPVTEDMLSCIRKAGISEITNIGAFDLPGDFFTRQILMLGSSTNLIGQDDFLLGEISGISASNLPGWFGSFYKPGLEIASITDWDEKVKRIVEEAPNWDIGCISGIPSWVELMLKEIVSYHKLTNIHEIWPGLAVYTTGGVAFEPYRKSLERLFAHPLVYIDTYLASEGFIAIQKRPDTMAMALFPDNGIFYEFVPFSPDYVDDEGLIKPGAPVCSLADASENVEYVLLVTTVSGAWRYMIGDTVTITDKARAEIRITGRTKQFLNVTGSQLSVNQMNDGLRVIEQEFDVIIKEFIVAAVHRGDDYVHKWFLSCDKRPDAVQVAEALDKTLQENNKNYKVARSRALKGVEVQLIPEEIFYKWSEETKKKGGQVKIPRVMKEEAFLEFESFVAGQP
ncbi:GH3 auxin-responsive promoter superfamily protein [Dyadobacter beijingensis]|uniref:GH3 auxin-responsive promoter superfamily protein n=1 Tax=Dyadobacter beijingensis TaxID=365489 RepID=A0ABQ2ICQ7_9BACT|nr:GH3 auxin-responsive promoter family protein [Dyadobacter beijingensis]GGN03601.1 GH3 auxin-responsive promoter superfamily protein [Dyadobacter beijingensis]